MAILKLANAGDEATLDITGCVVVEGQYGEQVQFDAGDDRLYLPLSSAARQLERLGFDPADVGTVVGEKLTFSRTPSNKAGGKPFWNINKAKNGAIPPTATPPKSAPAKQPISHSNVPDSALPPLLRGAEAEDNAELAAKLGGADVLAALRTKLAVYQALTEYVVRDIAPIYEEAKIGMSPESSAACVQTLYINAFGK